MAPEDIAKLPSSKLGIREPVENLRKEIGKLGDQVKELKVAASPVDQITEPAAREEGGVSILDR